MFDLTSVPFQLAVVDDAHYALYRPVWRDGEPLIQGLILNAERLYQDLVEAEFTRSRMVPGSALVVAYQGDVAAEFRLANRSGAAPDAANLLLDAVLAHPFADLRLIFSTVEVEVASFTVFWLWLLLLLALGATFVLIDRYVLRLVALNRQQRNFVAAVSHEMKTPLTSIRMYGEMLLAGWTDEGNRRAYYQYIHDESERLSRLIDNVLRLAKINNDQDWLTPRTVTVAEVVDNIRSKVGAQAARAGFEIDYDVDEGCAQRSLWVDPDALLQIVINLVDNAIKFSKPDDAEEGGPRSKIEIGCAPISPESVGLSIRDFGPGVPAKEQKRIFELFYRSGDELTRDAPGTGIGLALVAELCREMDASITLRNRQPGAEFCIVLPSTDPGG